MSWNSSRIQVSSFVGLFCFPIVYIQRTYADNHPRPYPISFSYPFVFPSQNAITIISITIQCRIIREAAIRVCCVPCSVYRTFNEVQPQALGVSESVVVLPISSPPSPSPSPSPCDGFPTCDDMGVCAGLKYCELIMHRVHAHFTTLHLSLALLMRLFFKSQPEVFPNLTQEKIYMQEVFAMTFDATSFLWGPVRNLYHDP